MSATQRLGTGRSSQFADAGGGGISMIDAMILKPFFQAQGILPATIFEDLYLLHATDYQNLNGGVLTPKPGGLNLTGGAAPANFGWDLGAAKSEALFVVGGLRCGPLSLGISLLNGVPSTSGPNADGYIAILDPFANNINLDKVVGGVYTTLDSDANIAVDDDLKSKTFALAIYFKASSGSLRAFIRIGNHAWYEFITLVDHSIASVRSVGIWTFTSAGNFLVFAPAAAYANP